jgi:uncharacterized protein YutD
MLKMTRVRHGIHICGDFKQKLGDYVYEYCPCGARWPLNRKVKPMDTHESWIEENT